MLKSVLVTAALACSCYMACQAEGKDSNDTVALSAGKVQYATTWESLGKLQRFGKKESASREMDKLRKAIADGSYKVVLIPVTLKNNTNQAIRLGYDSHNSWSHWAGLLYVQGKEGSVFNSNNHLAVGGEMAEAHFGVNAASGLTFFLTGGLPKSSLTPAGGSVSGKLAFVVPDWFEAERIFTRPNPSGGFYGTKQVFVRL